jgi:O-antigen/teichoic acid export membrane protein
VLLFRDTVHIKIQNIKSKLKNEAFMRHLFNSSWMLIEQILRILSNVFVGIYVARYLGPSDFGILSYVLAIATFLVALSRLGMDAVLVRELVQFPENKLRLLGTAFWLMAACGVISYLIVIGALYTFSEKSELSKYIAVISISAVFTAFSCIDYLFQSQLRAKYSTICKSAGLLITSAIKVAMVLLGCSTFSFVIAYLFDSVILALFFLVAAKENRIGNFFACFDQKIAKTLLKSAWPMVVTAVSMVLFMRIDQVMIKEYLGPRELGIYSAALKLYEAWATLPYMLTLSLIPAISRLKQKEEAVYYKGLSRILALVVWSSGIAVILSSIFGGWLIRMTFGDEYGDASSLINVLMATGVFAAMGNVSARYFNIERMEIKIASRTVVAAIINIGLNYILIPMYGVMGAAVATLTCAFIAYYLLDWFDPSLSGLLKAKHKALFLLIK